LSIILMVLTCICWCSCYDGWCLEDLCEWLTGLEQWEAWCCDTQSCDERRKREIFVWTICIAERGSEYWGAWWVGGRQHSPSSLQTIQLWRFPQILSFHSQSQCIRCLCCCFILPSRIININHYNNYDPARCYRLLHMEHHQLSTSI